MFMNNSPLSDTFSQLPFSYVTKRKSRLQSSRKAKQNKKIKGEKDIQSTLSVLKKWVSLVQSPSHVQLFATPWTAARQASLSITNSWSLLKLMSMESVIPSNHLILPSIFPSIRVFSHVWKRHFHQVAKVLGVSALAFSFSTDFL